MKRTVPRWLRRLLLSMAGVIATAVALAAILFLLLQTPAAKRLAVQRLETELTAATGFTVDIGGLEGTLPFSAAVTDIRIGDAGGTWLTVDRLTVDWQPMDLLQRRLHVTSIAAGTVALMHLPTSPKPEREKKKGLDLAIALPRLPVPTAIDGVRVARIVVAPALLGEAAVLELTGRAELGGAARDAALTLAATRIDGRDGRISLQLGQNDAPARLTLGASIEEPAGGLIARALALPGLPRVSLRLGGDGPATAWRGRLQLAAGSTRVDGDLTLAVGEALAVEFSAHAQDAGRLVPAIAAYVPPAVDLAARLRWHPEERLDVQELSIAAPEATVALTGAFDFAGNRVQASVDMAIADAARWRPLLAPASLRAAHLAGTIAGPLDQPAFALLTTVEELTTPDLSIVHAEGRVDGRATLQDEHLVTDLSIVGQGEASGLRTATPQLQAMIGDSATWSLRAALDLLHGDAEIAQARLAANGSTLEVVGSIGSYGRAIDARVQAEFASIAPLAPPLERPVSGRLSLTAKLSGDAIARRLSADVDARFTDFAVDEPTVTALLGTAPTIVGRLATSSTGLEINALRIGGAGATATADGTAALDGRSLDLNVVAAVTDIAPVADSLGAAAGGRFAGTLHLTRTAADPAFRFAGTAGLEDLAIDERVADLLGSAVHATAEGVLGPTDVQLDAARLAGAAITLEASGKAGDNLDLAYRLELPRLATLSRLAGTELAGSTTVTGNIRGARAAPVLAGDLSAESLRVADLVVESASGRLSARNLGAHAEGDLTLDLQVKQQRLSLATAYRRQEDGTLTLSDVKLTVPHGGASGQLALLPGGLLDGHLGGALGDLAVLEPYVGASLAGKATLDLSFSPIERSQGIAGALEINDLRLSAADGPSMAADRLAVKATLSNAFDAPRGHAEVRLENGTAGQLLLTQATLLADGPLKTPQLRLDATGEHGQPLAIAAAGELALDAGQRLRLDRLTGRFGAAQMHLNAPATLSRDARGFAVSGLDAAIGDGRLTADGHFSDAQLDAQLSLADLPLDLATMFVPQVKLAGWGSAQMRLAGTPAAPTAHGDVRARQLHVGGTGIAEMLGVDGATVFDIGGGQGRLTVHLEGGPELAVDGQLTAPLAFTLRPFAFDLAPAAPISGGIRGRIDLALVPRAVDLRGDRLAGRADIDMTVAGTRAAPRLTGEARLTDGGYESADGATVLREVTAHLTGDNDRIALQALTARDGGDGRLSARGSASLGAPDGARYEGELTLQQFAVNKAGDKTRTLGGHLAGGLTLLPISADGRRRFEATATIDDPTLDQRSLGIFGQQMEASAKGSIGAGRIELESARVGGVDGELTASGRVAEAVEADYRLALPRLATLTPLLGIDVAGDATVTGTIAGSAASPDFSATLEGRALRIAGVTLDTAAGKISARDLVNRPRGDLTLDLTGQRQRLSLATNYRQREDGAIALEDLRLSAPKTALSGELSVLPGGLLNGRLQGESGDLAFIGALIDRRIAGAATLDLAFTPTNRRQSVDARIDARNLSVVQAGDEQLSAKHLAINAHLADAFRAPSGRAELRIADVASGGLSVTRAAFDAEGDADALRLTIDAAGEHGKPFTVKASAELAVPAKQRLRLDRFDVDYGAVKTRLNAPATIARDGNGFSLAGLDASIGDGRLTGTGGFSAKQVDLRLSLADLPLEVLAAFAPQLDVGGKASADLRLAGTPSAPTAHGEVRLAALSVAGTKISETVGVNGTIKLDVQNGRAAVSANLGGSPDLNIDGQLTAPVTFRVQPFAADLAADAPITGKVVGKVDLGLVPRVVDLHGDTLDGQLTLDMTVAGTPAAPRLAGDARVSAGSYASADAGTVLRDMTVVVSGDNDRILLRSLTASDGGQGRLEASGSMALARAAATRYDGTLTLKNFTVVNRTDAVATASGRLQLENEAQGARLGGDVTVDSAELRVPDSLPPKVVKLDVVEINTPPDRVKPTRQTGEGTGLPVALAVTVKIPGRAFLRGRGIDSEWRGKLHVAGTMAKPDITGRLEVVRGRVDLLGQPFNVDTGAVNFVGGGAIDPELDFTAIGRAQDITARVRVTGRVSQPKFDLGTDSGLPPEEAMSRLLFGKSAGSLSSAQAIQLAQAAAELSGGGPGVLDKLRRTFGLDVLRVGTSSGSPDSASVEAGKYVSEDVYLKIEQGVTPESRQAGVEVRVLPHVTVEGGVGAQGSGKVGVNWRYDY
jgi:translocation and assembly module TamB